MENTEFELTDDENVIQFPDSVHLATSQKILVMLGKGEQRKLLDVDSAAELLNK